MSNAVELAIETLECEGATPSMKEKAKAILRDAREKQAAFPAFDLTTRSALPAPAELVEE